MSPTRQDDQCTVGDLAVSRWHGEGPTVLALAGLTSSGRVFGHLARRLGDRDVVAPHLRGRGGSLHVSGRPGLRGHARDVARVLEELDLHDVVVVGHSMGAYLAPVVAQEAAGRVARLVLVDGGVPPKLPFWAGPRATRFGFRADLRRLVRDWPSVEALATSRSARSARPPRPAPPARRRRGAGLRRRARPGAPAAGPRTCVDDAVDTFYGPDAAALATLAVPAHLLTTTSGKKDGAKPFLAPAVVDAWTARQPLLTTERVVANHVTVLFSDEVLAAVRG